jgi:hypothetical protein
MTKSKLWFAIVLVLLLSVSVSAFDGLELEDTKGIIGEEIGEIKPIEEVKYCIRADTKEYMPCSEWTKGETKLELASTQKLFVSMEGTYLYDSVTESKELFADRKEEASVYVHKVRMDDNGNRVYHVDNLNPVPVDAYVSFWYEQQPGMLWHKNKHSQIVRGYYPSDWTWVQEYTWSDEEQTVVPFGGTLTFLAYDLTENSVGSEQFLVGSFALDDRFYGNDTIANAANLLQNGSGFGKQFYHGNATNVTIADGAMVFNGNNSYFTHSYTVRGLSEVTFSFWIYFNNITPGAEQRIYDEATSLSLSSNRIGVLKTTDNKIRLQGRTGNESGLNEIFATSDIVLSENLWYFVTAIYNSNNDNHSITINNITNYKYLVTGSLNNSASLGSSIIGKRVSGTPNYLNANINEFKVFNRALNESEVSALYNQGRGSYSVIGNGLVAQYSGRDYNGTTDNVTTVFDTNHLVSSGPITIPNGNGIWAQPYNLTSKTAITFDGVDDVIKLGHFYNITNNSFSISAVIKPINFRTGAAGIVSKFYGVSGDRKGTELNLQDLSGSLSLRFVVGNGTDSQTIIHSNMVAINEYQFVYGSFNQTHLVICLNKVCESNLYTRENMVVDNPTREWQIGARHHSNPWFNGSIADVRIYNTSLTPEEVYQIYSGQNISTPAVFVSGLNEDYYRGDEVPVNVAVTGTAIDSVWYNLNGVNSTYTPGLSLSLLTGEYQLRAYANNTLGMIGSSALYSFRMSDVPKGCDDIRLGVNDSFSLASIALIILAAVSIIGILTVGFGGGMSQGVDVKVMIATLIVTGILLTVGIVLFNVITASIC